MTSLYALSAEYQEALSALADSDLPEEAVNDTLEGLQGELVDKARNVAAFSLNLDAQVEMIKTVEKRISERRKLLEKKADRLREYLRENMERCGIKKIEALDGSFVATLTAPRTSVVIEDQESLPKHYLRVKYEADKKAIGDALKDGKDIPGARLEHKSGLRLG